MYNKTKVIYTHLETHAQGGKTWQNERLSELTCMQEKREGRSMHY